MNIISIRLVNAPLFLIVSMIFFLDLFSYKLYTKGSCVDEPGIVYIHPRKGEKTCEWVGARNSRWRCNRDDVQNMCKLTCGTCECLDSVTFVGQFRGKSYRCKKISRKVAQGKNFLCKKVTGAIENCQATCKDECQQMPTETPTYYPTLSPTVSPTESPTASPIQSPSSTGPASWIQVGQDIDGEAYDGEFGLSVSLSSDGTRVAIGAPGIDGNDSGQVRVYDYNGSSWTQFGQDINGEGDEFGTSVSLSSNGTRVAIGAPYNNGNGTWSGQVQVYDYNGSSWTQVGQDIDGEAQDDNSGTSVSLSSNGTRVAIGAPSNDGNGSNSGQVRVYDYNGSSWAQVGQDIDGEAEHDQSGTSVSLSSDGTRVAIGAPLNDGNGADSGQVQVYDYKGSSWTQIGQDIDGEAAFDYSGTSVSLSSDGTRVAIGAPYSCSNSGQVRVYDYNGSSWTQVGQDIDGEPLDGFGTSVSLSSDGTRVAIGAPGDDGYSSAYGEVRVYDYDGSSWTQVGQDIYGEAQGEKFGTSVSLSSDGTRVAIGAPLNDGTGIFAGQVRVYSNE